MKRLVLALLLTLTCQVVAGTPVALYAVCRASGGEAFLGDWSGSHGEDQSRLEDNCDRVPLILIEEPSGFPGEADWVRDAAGLPPDTRLPSFLRGGDGVVESERRGVFWESGFTGHLISLGYKPGETLFTFLPDEPYQDLTQGALMLSGFLEGIIREQNASALDAICYGVSGLVMRYTLEKGYLRESSIRNLVMLDAPNRGSFLAGLLRSLCEIVRHESIVEKETRSSRFSPFGKVVVPSDEALWSDPEGHSRFMSPEDSIKNWQSELGWLMERVSQVYEPLYAQYVRIRHLSIPYFPTESPQETFAGWVKKTYPVLWENWIVGGAKPPIEPAGESSLASSGSEGQPPAPGQDLTLAYYEMLAMEIAKNQYVVKTGSRKNLVETLIEKPYVPKDWKEALLHYGLKVLSYYAGQAFFTVKAEVQKFLVQKIIENTGYARDPENPFLRRLLSESILVNLGSGQKPRFERVPANHFLETFNEAAGVASYSRVPRYISISGRVSNFWSLVWPGIGPNNWFCEVDSAVAPVGPRDVIRVFGGILAPSHLTLLKDGRVKDFVIGILSEKESLEDRYVWAPPVSLDVTRHEESTGVPRVSDSAIGIRRPDSQNAGKLRVSSWKPSYLEVESGAPVEVRIPLPSPPEGWGYLLWVEKWDAENGNIWEILPESCVSIDQGEMVTFHLTSSRRMGFRLVRRSSLNPVLGNGSIQSCYEREVLAEGTYFVKPLEEGTTPFQESCGTGTVGQPEHGESTNLGGTRPEETSDGWPRFDEQGEVQTPSTEDPDDDSIPMVRVVYRSKHTTLLKPEETYHCRWEADFGDGSVETVEGQAVLRLEHFYVMPGSYQAVFTSYDNYGAVVFQKRETVKVETKAGERISFDLRSIPRLLVEIKLTGPQKWVTGKPALFSAGVLFQAPPWATVEEVRFDPGERFNVLWERAGDFTVSCALALKVRYQLEDKTVLVKNTYLKEVPVTVLTGSMTR